MSAQHTPPMSLPEPIALGDVIEYQDFRTAARTLLERRTAAVRNYQEQAQQAADAEATYQQRKAARYVELKNTGGPDSGPVSAAEAGERLRGDDQVREAQIRRDLHHELLRARREDIAGVDEALATLRRLAEWSQLERGVNADQRPRPVAA